MKNSVSIEISEQKLSAIEMYLEQKNTTLTAELDRFIDQLYGKIVPQNVREFIEKMADHERPRKRRSAKNDTEQDQ